MRAVLLLALVCAVYADINMHNPRGGNNRLDESRRGRRNANRLFDSQNNNRGGHNVGGLYYYTGSHLQVQWANQHSCADPNNECELVLQYMCGDWVRDGVTTKTIPDNPARCKNRDCNTDIRFGMHENYDYYNECRKRQRNMGLFIADRNLRRRRRRGRNTAKYTRQNNNGQRRGYECPEERDYYPYWHPTPWRDIAVFTNDVSRCDMYRTNSENVRGRYKCVVPEKALEDGRFEIPNNKEACEKTRYPNNGKGTYGVWKEFDAHGIPAPECLQPQWSRDNHQGNTYGGEFMSYDWTVPNVPHEKCVFRIRYNITAGDVDGWDPLLDSKYNGRMKIYLHKKFGLDITEREARKRGYYYRNDPTVTIFKDAPGFKLKIQINTNQDARTFQDRSHTFAIRSRPAHLVKAKIHNVNVRGKRGNIVQVFPSTEYDFVPNTVTAKEGEYVHFQWTGSNSNPRNNAGEGRAGTDRSNVLPLADKCYPEGVDHKNTYGQWGRSYPHHHKDAVFLGFNRQELRRLALTEMNSFHGENQLLDDTGPYFDMGPKKVSGPGTYYYMSSRNNNFSNRSQKGRIIVEKA